ncbi:tRNA (adenosine(37)-N6)-dimethylallyltransferase MiaA [Bacillota bacterium LX-D]|nr:tRNA (adenosine(37)-N6)-dimethylallyltransferase MiaA [Bacillota bacterium LX-D]
MLNLGAIIGPTAVGKSKIAVEVAGKINAEIISADSVQIYKGFDIGSAKIMQSECYSSDGKYIKHYMLDVVEPDVDYSVADYQKEVQNLIPQICNKGKYPILVGGTGLYVQAVIDPYYFHETAINWDYRTQLFREAQEKGNTFVHAKLAQVDPLTAKRLHPNDLRRVIRALEILKVTGHPIWAQHYVGKKESNYNLAMVGLELPREILYNRIEKRVDMMIEQGLVQEVRNLIDSGFSPSLKSMQSLGYKQICTYLAGEISLDEAIRLIKRDTRRYAKRQLTWFKRDKRIKWFMADEKSKVNRIIEEVIKEFGRTINN